MGTTTKTDSNSQQNLQFNPQAEKTYNNLTGAGGNVLLDYIKNPMNNPFYFMSQAAGQKGAAQAGAQNIGALFQNQKAQGMGGTAGQGFMNAMLGQTGRMNTSMMSQANLKNIQEAFSRQMGATGMGMSFSPQLTGQSGTSSQTQQTGGLGTWLPQLMGGLMQGAMGAATGGASMGMNAAGSAPAFSGGIGSLQSAMNLPSNAFQPMPNIWGGSGGQMPMNPALFGIDH